MLRMRRLVVVLSAVACGAMMCPNTDTDSSSSSSSGGASGAAGGSSGGGSSSGGGAGSSSGGGSGASSGGAAASSSSSSTTGGTPDAGLMDCPPDPQVDAGRPYLDPARCLAAPGAYRFCPTAPTNSLTPGVISAGTATTYTFTGTVTGNVGNGLFYARGRNFEEITGTVPTDSSGAYSVTVPVFCEQTTVKLVWENAGCRSIFVYRVDTDSCVDADIRATLVWDELGRDWELHLIRPGGQLNDTVNRTDCTWNTCRTEPFPDWGVDGGTDNPRKDVDDLDAWGPENIWLTEPETGTFHVMVEHWSSLGDAASDGRLILNVRGKLYVVEKFNLAPQKVWKAATIEWPSGVVTPSQDEHTCVTWASGCQDTLP